MNGLAESLPRVGRAGCAGERCSCTTAVTDLLLNNFDLPCGERDSQGRRRCVLGGLPWKHGGSDSEVGVFEGEGGGGRSTCCQLAHAGAKVLGPNHGRERMH
jgi:hypothetical protein